MFGLPLMLLLYWDFLWLSSLAVIAAVKALVVVIAVV